MLANAARLNIDQKPEKVGSPDHHRSSIHHRVVREKCVNGGEKKQTRNYKIFDTVAIDVAVDT